MAAEWRRNLGEHSAICEAEELERVGGVNGVGSAYSYLDFILSSTSFAIAFPCSAAFVNHLTASL